MDEFQRNWKWTRIFSGHGLVLIGIVKGEYDQMVFGLGLFSKELDVVLRSRFFWIWIFLRNWMKSVHGFSGWDKVFTGIEIKCTVHGFSGQGFQRNWISYRFLWICIVLLYINTVTGKIRMLQQQYFF